MKQPFPTVKTKMMLTIEKFNLDSEDFKLRLIAQSTVISPMILTAKYACWLCKCDDILVEVRCEIEAFFPISEIIAIGYIDQYCK